MVIRYPEDTKRLFEQFHYPGGEQQVRFYAAVVDKLRRAKKVHVIARFSGDIDVVGLALLSDALGAIVPSQKRELILPYLPYGRGDRRFVPGDCHGLKAFMAIVDWMDYGKVKTLDVHSKVAKKLSQGIFENISPQALIDIVLNEIGQPTKILLADEGGGLRYGKGWPRCEKVRNQATGALSRFVVPSKAAFDGCTDILLVDDICDGGGTFIGIADELRRVGVMQRLHLYVTHGIFSNGTTALRQRFNTIYSSDSYSSLATGFYRLESLPLLIGSK